MPDLFFTEESDVQTLEDEDLVATRELPLRSRKTKIPKPIIENTFLGLHTKAKELMDQVNFVATHRQSEYLAELIMLQAHKSVAIRRKVASVIAFLATKTSVPDLQQWLLQESDKSTWLILDNTIEKLSHRLSESAELENSAHVLTVTEAIKAIKLRISEKVFTIEGELAEVKVFNTMYYFGIKDKADNAISCQCFSGKIAGFGFPVNEGWSVRISGKFKINNYSKLVFDVEKMWLTGEGEILRQLLELEKKLYNEGLFDPARKRQLNTIPTRILLLASPNSAAIDDFNKVLGQRRSGMTIYYLPIKTQGVGAEFEILSRLEIANHFCIKYDIQTVVLTRGGGSKEDLMIFNSEKIVRAIYALNRPSIVAIGHERDNCLSEKVADLRASTPSNAAELCSLPESEILYEVNNYIQWLTNYFQTGVLKYETFVENVIRFMLANIADQINLSKQTCKAIDNTIFGSIAEVRTSTQNSYNRILNIVRLTLQQLQYQTIGLRAFETGIAQRIDLYAQQLTFIWQEITTLIHQNLKASGQELISTFGSISLYDSSKILSLGYALVTQDGAVVEKISSIQKGKKITLQMQDGMVEV
jgi:exodeoxyribonuclease VII large subunit